jgi:hypothetical protein
MPEDLKGTITCSCGEVIPVVAHPMIAVEKPDGIHHTSHPGPADKIVPSDRELYWYDVDCPRCGRNCESVIGK